MPHEHDTPAATLAEPPPAPEPDFVARARRILAGDVRPDDYLATTPEVEELVAFDMADFTDLGRKAFEAGRIPAPFEPEPCVEVRQRVQYLLSTYYGGQMIVCTERDGGVIVLAVGLENCATLLNTLPYELVRQFRLGMFAPEEWGIVPVY